MRCIGGHGPGDDRPSGAGEQGSARCSAGPRMPAVAELKNLGVARVSFGSGLARAAYSAAFRIARQVLEGGVFDLSTADLTRQDLDRLLGRRADQWAGRAPSTD